MPPRLPERILELLLPPGARDEILEALPGVRAAGTISNLPLSPESWSDSLVIEGRDRRRPHRLSLPRSPR